MAENAGLIFAATIILPLTLTLVMGYIFYRYFIQGRQGASKPETFLIAGPTDQNGNQGPTPDSHVISLDPEKGNGQMEEVNMKAPQQSEASIMEALRRSSTASSLAPSIGPDRSSMASFVAPPKRSSIAPSMNAPSAAPPRRSSVAPQVAPPPHRNSLTPGDATSHRSSLSPSKGTSNVPHAPQRNSLTSPMAPGSRTSTSNASGAPQRKSMASPMAPGPTASVTPALPISVPPTTLEGGHHNPQHGAAPGWVPETIQEVNESGELEEGYADDYYYDEQAYMEQYGPARRHSMYHAQPEVNVQLPARPISHIFP